MLKNIDKYIKNLKEDLEKLQKYQDNVMHGLDYLFKLMVVMYYMKVKEIKIIN